MTSAAWTATRLADATMGDVLILVLLCVGLAFLVASIFRHS